MEKATPGATLLVLVLQSCLPAPLEGTPQRRVLHTRQGRKTWEPTAGTSPTRWLQRRGAQSSRARLAAVLQCLSVLDRQPGSPGALCRQAMNQSRGVKDNSNEQPPGCLLAAPGKAFRSKPAARPGFSRSWLASLTPLSPSRLSSSASLQKKGLISLSISRVTAAGAQRSAVPLGCLGASLFPVSKLPCFPAACGLLANQGSASLRTLGPAGAFATCKVSGTDEKGERKPPDTWHLPMARRA